MKAATIDGAAATVVTMTSAIVTRDESDLISRAVRRDPAAWSVIYDRHFLSLYRYAFARLRSPQEAEDVAAQVFLEALKSIERYEDRGRPILAWLYRIAHNLIVERLRRDERYRRATSALEGRVPAPVGPEASLDHIDLLDALAHLTRDQQEVIILRFFLQLSTREVAALVGKSQAAVFSLQVRGVAALKRRLDPPLQEAGRPAAAGPALP